MTVINNNGVTGEKNNVFQQALEKDISSQKGEDQQDSSMDKNQKEAKIDDAKKKEEEFKTDLRKYEFNSMKKQMALEVDLNKDQMFKFTGPGLQQIQEAFDKNLSISEQLDLKRRVVQNIKVLMTKEIWKKRADNSLDIGVTATDILKTQVTKFCEEQQEKQDPEIDVQSCINRQTNAIIINMLADQLTDENLVEDVKTLPMGSVPTIGKQTLEIEKMTRDIKNSKKSLAMLKTYQRKQLKIAQDNLILLEKTQKAMVSGHKLTHKLKTDRQKAIHRGKKSLEEIGSKLDKHISSIDDINSLEKGNEDIVNDFKSIRDKQKKLIKVNIPTEQTNKEDVTTIDGIKKLN